jgi:hypothetical protein
LVSFLDEQGKPTPVERALVCPPGSRIGVATEAERAQIIRGSLLFGHYEKMVDRESAYEILKGRTEQAAAEEPAASGGGFDWGDLFGGGNSAPQQPGRKPAGRQPDSVLETVAKSAARTIGSELGRQVIRGVLGSILGGKRR